MRSFSEVAPAMEHRAEKKKSILLMYVYQGGQSCKINTFRKFEAIFAHVFYLFSLFIEMNLINIPGTTA